MAWFRYLIYISFIAFVTWALTAMEIASPGGLELQVYVDPVRVLATSEYSPVEVIQVIILGACGLIMGWVARYCLSQRPLALLFGGIALAYFIGELDFFLDHFVAVNFWQVLVAIVIALLTAYAYRHRKRLGIALARIWPSPGLTLLFAGAVVLFAFVRIFGNEALWSAMLGDAYQPIARIAVEEFVELLGYFLWMAGTIEYAFQSRAIAYREPQPAARRRRDKRRANSAGRFW